MSQAPQPRRIKANPLPPVLVGQKHAYLICDNCGFYAMKPQQWQ